MRWAPLAFVLVASPVAAAPRKDFPCKGCLLEARATKSPLLIVLHGDGQNALSMEPAWSKPAAAHKTSLLLAQCPKDLGCKDSFWRWNGDPKWLDGLADAVAKEYPVDADRVWLAGWSGGATYLGLRAFELSGRFAAMTIDGGGMAPSAVCPKRVLPSYFLVGDQNPYHHYAIGLRDALTRCTGEVEWDLRKGQAHAGEWTALVASAGKILTWLEAHPR